MKGRKGCKSGGGAESPKAGSEEFEQDLKTKPADQSKSKVEGEAEERKRGGRAKKHVGKVHGEKGAHHAGRKPRKSGGRSGCDQSPFSSARHGTDPKGHKTKLID